MDEYRLVEETVPEIVALTGITHPNIPPFEDCTFVTVAWNEERRIGPLLDLAKEWFPAIVVGVQESQDRTLEIAEASANRARDRVLREPHLGFGEASMPRLIEAAKTPWVFSVACDELPSLDLLESLDSAMAYAMQERAGGVWINFRSIVEGVEYNEQHGHLRLFRSGLGWPQTLHSRPKAKIEIWWPYGHIRHERSLDEMMQDYLRYWDLGRGNKGWERHNREMMHDACEGVAQAKGWGFVQSFGWWPAVKEIAFKEENPGA